MIVDRMERDGLVERKRDVNDSRSLRFMITEKGDKAFQQALGPGWEVVRHVLSGLTGNEILLLVQLLEKMKEKAYEYAESGANKGEIKKM